MAQGSFPTAFSGKLFLVSGLAEGAAVFVGRARSEPSDEPLTLEGKLVHISPAGQVLAQPFATLVRFFLHDAAFAIQHVEQAHIAAELTSLLESHQSLVSPVAHPFLQRWFLATCRRSEVPFGESEPRVQHPAYAFYEQFVASAEQFRRALYRSPQVSSVRELDKVSELEGNLLVEIGKISSRVAIKLNQLVGREPELKTHLAAFYGDEFEPRPAISGFAFVSDRLQFAKDYARRTGRASIVREINVFVKDAFFGLHEVVMEHNNSLDTLMTETFNHYGIRCDETNGSALHPYVTNEQAGEHAGKLSSHPSPVGAS